MLRRAWIVVLLALMAAGYIVPYTVLSGVERWSAAFLFWLVFAVAVWALLVAVVSGWRTDALDAHEREERL